MKIDKNQTATYWLKTDEDGFNKSVFATPITILVRWSDKIKLMKNSVGEEVISKSKIFVGIDMHEGDFLFLGTSTEVNPVDVDNAFEIIAKENIPNLKGVIEVQKVYL